MKGKRPVTLSIQDGERVYEFVACVSHKKKELITLESVQQVRCLLWPDQKYITCDEERELSHLKSMLL